jgi:hypothetical protein
MAMTRQSNLNANERGSIFFYILLGVVLFGALAFTISRGMRSQSTDNMTKRQTEMAASEIVSVAQGLAKGIDRMRQNSVSESDFCFAHENLSEDSKQAYERNAGCEDDKNKLFHAKGGSISYSKVPEGWLESSRKADEGYGEWIFSDQNALKGITDDSEGTELIAHINYLKRDLCEAVNKALGIEGVPDNAGSFRSAALFTGAYTPAGQIDALALAGKQSGCFQSSNNGNSYIFYTVLIERE